MCRIGTVLSEILSRFLKGDEIEIVVAPRPGLELSTAS